MLDINEYTSSLTSRLLDIFGDRLVYVGLQGSYLRVEADENSDVDIMTVIDELKPKDLENYKSALTDDVRDCGFICGKNELAHWNPLEICQLTHTTRDIYGSLMPLVPPYTTEDEINYIKFSLGALYHELCHRYIYTSTENCAEKLPYTFKSAFFILQNLYFIRTGDFINSKAELSSRLDGCERELMLTAKTMSDGGAYDFERAFELIFSWCQKSIAEM